MSDEYDERIEARTDAKLGRRRRTPLYDGFKGNKTMSEVLDKKAVMTIYGMIGAHIISRVHGSVKAGKESVVFWAEGADGGDVALKVYLVSTSNFKRRWPYMLGDRRFGRIKGGTRNMVNLWARKEYRNVSQCHAAGIPVPRPVHVSGNVLAMGFVGEGGVPAKTLLETQVDMADYRSAVAILTDMYREAGLVHGDYSEYNIFKENGSLTVFDLGSAVDKRHAGAPAFLRRDIRNITRFFVRRGLTVPDPESVYAEVTG
jgi:RIO kinase 1